MSVGVLGESIHSSDSLTAQSFAATCRWHFRERLDKGIYSPFSLKDSAQIEEFFQRSKRRAGESEPGSIGCGDEGGLLLDGTGVVQRLQVHTNFVFCHPSCLCRPWLSVCVRKERKLMFPGYCTPSTHLIAVPVMPPHLFRTNDNSSTEVP